MGAHEYLQKKKENKYLTTYFNLKFK